MSRSTRKPYGGYEYRRKGTKANRSLGHRTFRHAAKQQLNTVIGFDEYLPLNPRELWACSPVAAGCVKSLWAPNAEDWSQYCLAQYDDNHYAKWRAEWPPKWRTDLIRK
jgi:hypothetical protein